MSKLHKPKVVLVGDTSLRTPHFGCQLVGQTFREQFSRVGIDLIATLPTDLEQFNGSRHHLEKADLVVINGEGSIHHGRFQELIDLASEFPCALVNCVYQENPSNGNLHKFKYISVRETMSASAVRDQGVDPEIVPDVLFSSMFLNSYVQTSSVQKEFGVTDNAKKETKHLGLFKLKYRPGFSPKTQVVGDYLEFLSSHRKMAVGRFHAAVSCSVLGIPFSSWDSNTWKTKGLMLDMGISHLHFDSRNEAITNMPEEFPEEIIRFRRSAKKRIEAMFDKLETIAKH